MNGPGQDWQAGYDAGYAAGIAAAKQTPVHTHTATCRCRRRGDDYVGPGGTGGDGR